MPRPTIKRCDAHIQELSWIICQIMRNQGEIKLLNSSADNNTSFLYCLWAGFKPSFSLLLSFIVSAAGISQTCTHKGVCSLLQFHQLRPGEDQGKPAIKHKLFSTGAKQPYHGGNRPLSGQTRCKVVTTHCSSPTYIKTDFCALALNRQRDEEAVRIRQMPLISAPSHSRWDSGE